MYPGGDDRDEQQQVGGAVATVTLAATVRRARERAGLSLVEVQRATRSRRFADGLATSYVNRLERGEVAEPSPHALRSLAKALDLPYARLMREAGYYP